MKCWLQATAYTTLMQVDGGRMETYIQRCPEPCVLWWRRCLACYKTTALRYFHHQHHHRQRHQWTVSRRLWRHFCSLRLLNCTFHLMLCYLTLMHMHRMIGRVWLPCYGALEIIVTLLIIIIIMVSWGSAPSSEHSRLHSLTPIWVTLQCTRCEETNVLGWRFSWIVQSCQCWLTCPALPIRWRTIDVNFTFYQLKQGWGLWQYVARLLLQLCNVLQQECG